MLRAQIAQRLVKTGARNVVHDDNQIRFSGKLLSWSLSKWHFYFNLISKGVVTVDCHADRLNVVYQISFIDSFALLLSIIGFWILVLFVFAGVPLARTWPILGLFLFFLVWLGGNIALTCYHFNRFMKNCLHEFFNSSVDLGVEGELIASR